MKSNTILVIFKKEIRDMFRDRRTRNSTLVMPFLISLMMIGLYGFIFGAASHASDEIYIVNYNSPAVSKEFTAIMKSAMEKARKEKPAVKSDIPVEANQTPPKLINVNSADEAKSLVKEGKAHVVIEILHAETAGPRTVNIYYDPKTDISRTAESMVEGWVTAANQESLEGIVKAKGVPLDSAKPYKLTASEVSKGGKQEASQLVIGILPYMMVIWAFFGGMSIGSDLVAGEKDKNTLETLLITPASRTEIVLGKFLALGALCLIGSTVSFIGCAVATNMSFAKQMFPHGLGISLSSVVMLEVVIIPTVAFFASLLLAISSFAKNPREAQSYLSGVSTIVLIPMILNQVIGLTNFSSSPWLSVIPIMNTGTAMRQILLNNLNYTGLAITIVMSLVLAVLGLSLAVKLFNREQVLTRV